MLLPATPRSLFSNAAWNIVGTAVSIALAFLLAPLLIQRLGVEQWGLLLLVWSVSGVLGLSNFGMGEATLRYVARYHAEGDLGGVNRVLGASLTFYLLVCLSIVTGLWILAPAVARWVIGTGLDPRAFETPLRLSAVIFMAGMFANAYRAVPMALNRYDVSSVAGSGLGIFRAIGLLSLAAGGAGVTVLVAWEVLVALVSVFVYMIIARRLVPGLRLWPSMRIASIREIIGYSMYSFLTHVFLVAYRESGKLILGSRLGPAGVAYLGTPDSVTYRIHSVVVSGVETLVPRFSTRTVEMATLPLLAVSTWVACLAGAALYMPVAVVMPDFLRLWINPDFARHSGEVGQLLTIGLLGAVTFAPIATLFRGVGKPGYVTITMAAAGGIVLFGSLVLIPRHGVIGVGYAYALATTAWLGALGVGWIRMYGRGEWGSLLRSAGLPLIAAVAVGLAGVAARRWMGEPGWLQLALFGTTLSGLGAVLAVALDLVFGGHASPSRLFLQRLRNSRRLASLSRRFTGASEP